MHIESVKRERLESVEDFCYERLLLIWLELFSLSLSNNSHLVVYENDNHLVVYEVCKYRRK
ncbi:hypothetical protein Taro_012794 [Colocasia esculenta]|uniref:Uncharacterized protein n=1 Tax=Colocasia esculenta TaxID=4460 RepID=A0A843U9R3_COLES|nr:hypothetical protein [Colocasia esculenta]